MSPLHFTWQRSADGRGLLPGQLYFLRHGRTRLSSLPRSLSPGVIVVKCIYEHGPSGLSASLPDIARFSAPLSPAATALTTKTQSDLLSPNLHDLRQPRTRCGRTDCSSIQDATTVSSPPSSTPTDGPIKRVGTGQIGVFDCADVYTSSDSPGTRASCPSRQAQILPRHCSLKMERG